MVTQPPPYIPRLAPVDWDAQIASMKADLEALERSGAKAPRSKDATFEALATLMVGRVRSILEEMGYDTAISPGDPQDPIDQPI